MLPVARGSTGGVLGMLAEVKDPVRLLRRIAVTVVGTVILAVGVVLLVAPGPGLVVIALALAVFAIEYQWARRNLAAVQERARSAALKAAASRVATASAVLFGVGAIGLGVVLIFTDLLPLSGAGTGVGAAVGGLTVLLTPAYGVREMRNAKKAEERKLNRFGRWSLADEVRGVTGWPCQWARPSSPARSPALEAGAGLERGHQLGDPPPVGAQ